MKQKVFKVPNHDASPINVLPGLALNAAANEDVPLRERPPIVEAPGLLISFNRSGILITSALLAAFTAWSITRVFLFLAWLAGANSLDYHFIALGGIEGVYQAIASFVTGVAILCGGLFAWAFYNWVRFHGPDRRREPKSITDRAVAERYGLPPPLVWRWQYAKWLRAHHDDRGVVVGAESNLGTWIRGQEEVHPVIKPNTFDILYLSARSRLWRKQASAKRDF